MLPLSIPTSQQIPTFTPLMCDLIVHIPVIDVCSSGQGYLMSASHSISTATPPMYPNLANPLISESNSVVEKGARETLRMFINSSNQPNTPLIEVLPSVLANGNEMQNILAAGSRGIYSETRDVDAIASIVAAMVFVSTSDRIVHDRCVSRDRGIYSGTRGVDAIASSVAAMAFVSTSDRFVHDRCVSRDKLIDEVDNSDCTSRSPCDDGFPESERI